MNYYPFHIGDYMRETAHLSMLEDAAYRRLLDLYYTTEKPFTQPVDKLCDLVRAKSSAEKQAVKSVLAAFFQSTDGSEVRHKRCDREIAKAKEKSTKASTSASVRWQSKRNANALPTQSEGNAPNTNTQYPINTTGDKSPEKPTTPRWWESPDATYERAKELGLSTRGQDWAQLKSAVRDAEAALKKPRKAA